MHTHSPLSIEPPAVCCPQAQEGQAREKQHLPDSDPVRDRGTEGPGVPRFGFHWEGYSQSSNLSVLCSGATQNIKVAFGFRFIHNNRSHPRL